MTWPSDARSRGDLLSFHAVISGGPLGLSGVSEFNVLIFVDVSIQKLCHIQRLNEDSCCFWKSL